MMDVFGKHLLANSLQALVEQLARLGGRFVLEREVDEVQLRHGGGSAVSTALILKLRHGGERGELHIDIAPPRRAR